MRRSQLLALVLTFIESEHSFPSRFAKYYFGSGFLAGCLPAFQEYSRTRVRKESRRVSVAVWKR